MTSSPNAKPLNPEAQPFRARHYLKLPNEFYHRRSPPLPLPLPPPPPPPVERWLAELHMPCYSGPLYHLGLFSKHPPALGSCYVRYYQQPHLLNAFGGGRAFTVAELCGDGGGAGVAENKLVVKRKEVGVVERIRSTRKGPWRRVSGPSVWRPKSKSKSSGGGGVATVHRSSPPRPPPPPPQSQFDDVSCCGRTTIMIKNIPNQYRRNMLLDFLDKHCQEHNQKAKLQSDPLHLAYDFVYLPMDFGSGYNLGYAFVNFTSSGAALKIAERINHFKWGVFKTSDAKVYESKKICEITWAKIQGKDDLVKHFKNSTFTCANVEYLPVVLSPPRNGSTTLSLPNPVGKCLA